MQIIAHRGGSAHAPENTFAAFDNALAMGLGAFEFDLRLSADGVAFVIHDATVDRTTNGRGLVSEMTSDAISALDAGQWYGPDFAGARVPRFDDVLQRYLGRATLHIEIKDNSRRLARQVAETLQKARAFEHCWVTSFHPKVIAAMRAATDGAQLALLTRKRQVWTPQALLDAQVQMVCPHASLVTAALVDTYHAAGLLVRPWGLKGDMVLAEKLSKFGVFGCTFPDLAVNEERTHQG